MCGEDKYVDFISREECRGCNKRGISCFKDSVIGLAIKTKSNITEVPSFMEMGIPEEEYYLFMWGNSILK